MSENINLSIEIYKSQSYEKIANYERNIFLLDCMRSTLSRAQNLLDIGCAKGETIYLLKKNYPNVKYTGVEYSSELVQIAKDFDFFKDVNFIVGDARNLPFRNEFDTVLLSGVLSIFDDYELIIKNMIDSLKPGGTGVIFEGFNSDDIDVTVRFRNNAMKSTIWESGWNMFSLKSITRYLEKFATDIKVEPFVFKGELSKDPNPVSSYTVKTQDGGSLILTGGNIRREFFVLSFRKMGK